MPYPTPIQEFVENLSFIDDRAERIQILIELSRSYKAANQEKPYPAENRVPGCESEVYTWLTLTPEGTLNLDIAVDNPQGISAMSLAALIASGLQNQLPTTANQLDEDLVYALFGKELSMGKSMGLTNLVRQIKAQAANLT
ncbi:MAG: SufE family protein [Fimbriimonadaceae bacterium]